MPFLIHVNLQALKKMGLIAAIAAAILLFFALSFFLSPVLFRMLIITLWLTGLASALPQPRQQHLSASLLIALGLMLLHLLLEPGCQRFINTAFGESIAPAGLRGDAALINRNLLAGRAELLLFMRTFGRLFWPTRLELLIALFLTGVLDAAWPMLHRSMLRRTVNSSLTRVAWLLREPPRRLGKWIRYESGRGLLMGALWAGGVALLGYNHPAAAGLLMALASPTPFWGPAFAAGLTLFFAADAQRLLMQTGGAIIVFAVAWLATHLLFANSLAQCRAPLSKAAVLLFVLTGYALAGLGGLFFAAPLLSAAILIATNPADFKKLDFFAK
jgi:predicted PurR-regulated permease PerM